MRLIYFLAIAAVIAAIWFRFRRRVETKPQPNKQPKLAEWNPDSEYQAISINLGENHCAAAAAIAYKHFTPQQAPRFPLEGCDQKNCNCSYSRESDRREAGRRRADDGLDDIVTIENERRKRERRH